MTLDVVHYGSWVCARSLQYTVPIQLRFSPILSMNRRNGSRNVLIEDRFRSLNSTLTSFILKSSSKDSTTVFAPDYWSMSCCSVVSMRICRADIDFQLWFNWYTYLFRLTCWRTRASSPDCSTLVKRRCLLARNQASKAGTRIWCLASWAARAYWDLVLGNTCLSCWMLTGLIKEEESWVTGWSIGIGTNERWNRLSAFSPSLLSVRSLEPDMDVLTKGSWLYAAIWNSVCKRVDRRIGWGRPALKISSMENRSKRPKF